MILLKAVESHETHFSQKRWYNLRAIRAYRSTEWLKEKREYQAMGWKPLPHNPLSHTNESTVMKYYAAEDAGNELDAYERCCKKYPEEARKM